MKVDNIGELLNGVRKGGIVLPDFQREFVWEPEDIRQLLISVINNYFIGSMLMMGTFSKESFFALKLVEGVKDVFEKTEIDTLVYVILDGQQRVTSLFYALFEPNIKLKNRKSSYVFYLDLRKIYKALEDITLEELEELSLDEINDKLNIDWDECVKTLSKSNNKQLGEFEEMVQNNQVLPFRRLRSIEGWIDKIQDSKMRIFIRKLSTNFHNYKLHIIEINEKKPDKIVEIFERINKTGIPLSVFDLLTAKLYKDGIKLRDLYQEAEKKYSFINEIKPELIIRTIVLLRGLEPKRKNLLNVDSDNFIQDWVTACSYLEKAYNRMIDHKNGYGIISFRKWAPYSSLIVPLAVLLKEADKKKIANVYSKIDIWYWISVFSQRYDQGVDSKSFSDIKVIRKWFENDDNIPQFIRDINLTINDINVSAKGNAVYKAIINLIAIKGALDFQTGQPPQFDKDKIQDDHIFPKSIYKENSIFNKTIITTNQQKYKKVPSIYFRDLLEKHGEQKLKEILKSHLIPEEALPSLLRDDIEGFMRLRSELIYNEIKRKITV